MSKTEAKLIEVARENGHVVVAHGLDADKFYGTRMINAANTLVGKGVLIRLRTDYRLIQRSLQKRDCHAYKSHFGLAIG